MTKEKAPKFIKQLVDIHEAAFSPGWPANVFLAHMQLPSDDVVSVFKDGETQDGEVYGFVITRTAADQAEILTIAVAQTHLREGWGRSLLKHAETRVLERGADIIFLDVAMDNLAAINFYEKNGYHQCGTRPGYYRREVNGVTGRVDAILYKKHLA